MSNYPEQGELVLIEIRKIMPYGAFCALQEYPQVEAFLHVSEVSPGWIRNIREYIKEGQKTVAMVVRVDLEKHQIDISLKRVSEADKKRKQENYKLEKRAQKIIERIAKTVGKPEEAKDVFAQLAAEYGDAFAALVELSEGKPLRVKLAKKWEDELLKAAQEEIKPKSVSLRASLEVRCYSGDGVVRIRSVLSQLSALPQTTVHYLGAPKYFIDVTAEDFKQADKMLDKARALIEREKDIEFSIEKIKA